jgi:eukaryotic-like serine/threonine-protein kinase
MSNYCPACKKDHDDSQGRCPGCGDPLPSRAVTGSLVGRLVDGRYHIESRLGEGGMGEVYVAHQAAVGRKVALKRLLPEHMGKPQIAERFGREARAMACLESDHTIRLFDFGSVDAAPYFTMELLEGATLEDDIAAAGQLSPDRALAIVEQVCESLEDAHEHDLLHRDLKPANIFLARDRKLGERVKVLDFGIAKFLDDEDDRLTAAGDVVGTPHYVSPEALRGDQLDGRADLYALGIIVYEMLSGACPFQGRTPLEIISMHLTEVARPVHEACPQAKVPRPVSDFLVRALDKEPAGRPADAAAFAAALREAVEEGRELSLPDMAVTSPGLATGPMSGTPGLGGSPLTAKATPAPALVDAVTEATEPVDSGAPADVSSSPEDVAPAGGVAFKASILAAVVALIVVAAAWILWAPSGDPAGAPAAGERETIEAPDSGSSLPAAAPDAGASRDAVERPTARDAGPTPRRDATVGSPTPELTPEAADPPRPRPATSKPRRARPAPVKERPSPQAPPPIEAAPQAPVVAPSPAVALPPAPTKPNFELKPVQTREDRKKDLFRMKKVN